MKDLYASCGISRQSHAEAILRENEEELRIPFYIGFIEEVRALHPGMGLRKMYNQFKPEEIGRDDFIALGLKEGYRLRSVGKPEKTTYSVKSAAYKNLLTDKRFTNVNQVWASDIFYFSIIEKHYYVVLIMDLYSRRIVGWSAADNLRAENNLKALNMALTLRGIKNYDEKLIHHSDRGSQYISNDYTNLLKDYGIQISMCTNVLENSHCERANGIIKNEYLKRFPINSYANLQHYLAIAVEAYNNRLHNVLKMTPFEYETYVKELKETERPKMEIFTTNKLLDNPYQLSFNFGI